MWLIDYWMIALHEGQSRLSVNGGCWTRWMQNTSSREGREQEKRGMRMMRTDGIELDPDNQAICVMDFVVRHTVPARLHPEVSSCCPVADSSPIYLFACCRLRLCLLVLCLLFNTLLFDDLMVRADVGLHCSRLEGSSNIAEYIPSCSHSRVGVLGDSKVEVHDRNQVPSLVLKAIIHGRAE